MKIRMSFGKLKTILVIVVMIGSIALIALDICMLAGVRGIVTSSPAIAGVSLAAAIVICIMSALVAFNCFYKFKDDGIVAIYGIFADKMPYDKIVCLKQNSLNGELYIVALVSNDKKYLPDVEQEMAYRVNIASNQADLFIHALKEKRGDIVIDLYTPEIEDKKKK